MSQPTPPAGGPDDLDGVQSPLSAVAAASVGLHELFLGFMQGGFTEAQALHLTTAVLINTVNGRSR